MKQAKLIGTSTALAKNTVPFDEINDYLGLFDRAPEKIKKWTERIQPVMKEMLGVEYTHYAFNSETRTMDEDNLSLSVKAAKLALADAGMDLSEIDCLIYAGGYSHQMPPMSARLQGELGMGRCAEYQIHANCTSVYKAVKLAHSFLLLGEYKNILVVSSNVISSCFVPEYYNQEILTKEDIFLRWYLCDGAGAFVLTAADEEDESEGFYLEHTYVESGGVSKPSAMGNRYQYYLTNPKEEYERGAHHIKQLYINVLNEYAMEEDGQTIFFHALKRMLAQKEINVKELAAFVVNMPSKSVRNLISEECASIGISQDIIFNSLEKSGYVGPPAGLISIDKVLREKTFKDGDLILSFVMEVSKFMQAGFSLRYRGGEKRA
ncbi:3-oxoacyl-ACP synthase III family protein [Zhenpiania hominis]|uniref:3-oxoacyl-ACP synthase III family protein n=1 Tax=Zhenpiania hominis TaxID=2763644 RepID=A0A923SQL3_9FIRM|nr:3-oxoacyl-ACP synthase III family protein [Zhenpiania hominis]MBC6679752.1 3-oxoacyl-ACP synthase III family protein [Zhenpiania hominis]